MGPVMEPRESRIMTTALLLVDIQNDYFPGGSLELDRMTEVAARALAEFLTTGA